MKFFPLSPIKKKRTSRKTGEPVVWTLYMLGMGRPRFHPCLLALSPKHCQGPSTDLGEATKESQVWPPNQTNETTKKFRGWETTPCAGVQKGPQGGSQQHRYSKHLQERPLSGMSSQKETTTKGEVATD